MDEPCKRCAWMPWETSVWLATAFVGGFLLFAIYINAMATLPTIAPHCGAGRTATPCPTTTTQAKPAR